MFNLCLYCQSYYVRKSESCFNCGFLEQPLSAAKHPGWQPEITWHKLDFYKIRIYLRFALTMLVPWLLVSGALAVLHLDILDHIGSKDSLGRNLSALAVVNKTGYIIVKSIAGLMFYAGTASCALALIKGFVTVDFFPAPIKHQELSPDNLQNWSSQLELKLKNIQWRQREVGEIVNADYLNDGEKIAAQTSLELLKTEEREIINELHLFGILRWQNSIEHIFYLAGEPLIEIIKPLLEEIKDLIEVGRQFQDNSEITNQENTAAVATGLERLTSLKTQIERRSALGVIRSVEQTIDSNQSESQKKLIESNIRLELSSGMSGDQVTREQFDREYWRVKMLQLLNQQPRL